MEFTSEDDYKVIKKKDKQVSSDEEPLSAITEELFENYIAPPTHVNLIDGYNNLRIVLSQNPLLCRFTTSSPITMRNVSLDHLIRLLQGTEKPVLTRNSKNPLSNEELAPIVRKATNKVDCRLNTVHANFKQHRRQHWSYCRYYYSKLHGSSN